MPDDEKLAAVRELLPATGAGIYLNTGTAGPLPAETAKAMADLADWELQTGRAHPSYFEETLVRLDEARGTIAAVLHARVESIALTHGTTDGMNIAAWSLDWQPGDRLVTTDIEYPGVVAGLLQLCERRGVELVMAEVARDGDDDRTIATVADAIDDRTRLVACSHVAYTTGLVLPVAGLAAAAHDRGAFIAVDGAQAAGAINVDVQELGVDLYALPAQKWLLGPEGMGALYCRRGLEDRVRPAFAGSLGMADSDAPGAGLVLSAQRFEATNFHVPSVVGVARSAGWMAMYVGLDWITNRARVMALDTFELLSAIDGVELLTPVARMATLLTFRIAGWPAQTALDELGARVFAIARTVPSLDAIRISVGFFNTAAEIARFCAAVEDLARYTPETIPARRMLTVLGQGDG